LMHGRDRIDVILKTATVDKTVNRIRRRIPGNPFAKPLPGF